MDKSVEEGEGREGGDNWSSANVFSSSKADGKTLNYTIHYPLSLKLVSWVRPQLRAIALFKVTRYL